jgi:hypothetical protein
MRSVIIAALLLFSNAAYAAGYTKPAGAPSVLVPNYGVEVGVWAAQTPVGHGIGVFEKRADGWYLCGVCAIPEYPTMDGPVAAAGGPGPYVESKRAEINAILASRYPAIGGEPTGSAIDRVNQSLAGNVLRLIEGSPQLGPR